MGRRSFQAGVQDVADAAVEFVAGAAPGQRQFASVRVRAAIARRPGVDEAA